MENKNNILITGGLGFLGRNLVQQLQQKYNLCVLDLFLKKDVDTPSNVKYFEIGNIDIEKLIKEESIKYIIHTATLFGRNDESIQYILRNNLLFGVELFEAAMDSDVELFINTDTVLARNTSNYALSKKQFLDWTKVIWTNKIQFINLKLEHFYGLGASNNNFIHSMIDRMQANEYKIDLTYGEQTRDFIYIDDVISAFELIIEKRKLIDSYEEIEVSTGKSIKIKDVVQIIKKLTKSQSTLNFGALPYRPNEMMSTISDNSKIVGLGWSPKVTIQNGLNKIIKQ